MKLEFSRQIFEKYSNIKFHENHSSGSRVVPCGRTDGQADMTKLIVIFCNFANVPKNIISFVLKSCIVQILRVIIRQEYLNIRGEYLKSLAR
jgi:hypothetical protein